MRFPATLTALLFGCCVHASDSQLSEMRSLDEQVQQVKTDVLSIASELALLEERLLFPSNTQVAVFVALGGGENLRLDAVHLTIDGEPATHYIYSFKELEALQKGGVQRLYTGNIGRGNHAMEVTVMGKLLNGKEFTYTENFSFTKEIDPQLLGLTIVGPASGEPPVQMTEW